MINSQLIEVFRVLTTKERKLLTKYVRSPLFNTRADVIKLCDYLCDQHPFDRLDMLKKSYVFGKVFPDQPYDEKQIRYTMSFLFKGIKSFLTYQEFLQEPVNEELYLARFFKNRGLERSFNLEVKQLSKQLNQQPYRTSDYHYKKYQLHYEKFDFSINQKRETTESIGILSDEITTFFIATKLKLGCSTIILKGVSQMEYQQQLIDEVLTHVEANDYSEVPAIEIYYNAYKTFTDASPEPYYRKLRESMNKFHYFFPKEELINIYLIATNFCIKQFNRGKSEFFSELFDLYKKGLQLDIYYIENGIIPRFMYKNIVTAGLIEKDFEWVETFIYAYKEKLEEKYRESTFVYNLANMYYYKLEYDKAMELLREMVFDDVLNDLAARCILLKIYYELEEFDPLESLLESLRVYLQRSKDLAYRKQHYNNILIFTRQLLQLPAMDKKERSQFRQRIQAAEIFAEKDWFLKQVGG